VGPLAQLLRTFTCKDSDRHVWGCIVTKTAILSVVDGSKERKRKVQEKGTENNVSFSEIERGAGLV
jgi:hypothetical protein